MHKLPKKRFNKHDIVRLNRDLTYFEDWYKTDHFQVVSYYLYLIDKSDASPLYIHEDKYESNVDFYLNSNKFDIKWWLVNVRNLRTGKYEKHYSEEYLELDMRKNRDYKIGNII